MAIKTWEAVDVSIHRVIRMWLDAENNLHILRAYDYVDAEANPSPFGGSEHEEVMAWVDVPTDIQGALTKINDFINSKIRQKEGLA